MNVFFFNKSTKDAVKTQQRRRNKGGGSELATEKGVGIGESGGWGKDYYTILSTFNFKIFTINKTSKKEIRSIKKVSLEKLVNEDVRKLLIGRPIYKDIEDLLLYTPFPFYKDFLL
jgi:phosphoglycerate dehydrogenase-like enzyme